MYFPIVRPETAVLGRSDKVIVTVMEDVGTSFITRNILKPNFHNCGFFWMVVDSRLRAGKIRSAVLTVVEVLLMFYRCVSVPIMS